ncbi:MAG: excinuclease ABC subunit UvrB [bacterium]|nr:excinuclease ABC subunit UvrB [bacterium]
MNFKLISNFEPQGDQPTAIAKLTEGLKKGLDRQTLLGVTGSGKTFTMASVIAKAQMPTLIISPNKTLAAQLYHEFKNFFPENAVRYFVSYYDYYQPEAYLPATETYISKDAKINKEIDKLRQSAMQALLTRNDTIIIASVSCIYGLGDPEEYRKARLKLQKGQRISLKDCQRHLAFIQYEENEGKLESGQYIKKTGKKGKNESLIIRTVNEESVSVEFAKNSIVKISAGKKEIAETEIYPAKLWITPQNKLKLAIRNIQTELEQRSESLQMAGKFEIAERLEKRVKQDLKMLEKHGYVSGIENYSRHLSFRQPGKPPLTLLDYFPKPFLLFIDESHITVSQIQGMYQGDRQRKTSLIEYGFRLPSALDNRPLIFEEFRQRQPQTIYVSATPSIFEIQESKQVVEQLVRPTGILDPEISVRPATSQIADLLEEIKRQKKKNKRTIALTLTKRSAENLAQFLKDKKIKTHYIHSEIKTLQRPELLNDLRRGDVDVIVGINLLREGLDLPEVGLVAILDADREGFLRNHRSLIQMAGRAARSINGQVVIYADTLTGSIKKTLEETQRRRQIQKSFNRKMGIEPKAIKRSIASSIIKND